MSFDWTKPQAKVSRYFTVREALYLPQWDRLATEADGLDSDAETGLISLFQTMDIIRDILGSPIDVHVAYRPWKYNKQIGGATQSAHVARKIFEGNPLRAHYIAAVDFSAEGGLPLPARCELGRQALLPHLTELGLRMEDNGQNAPWIHLDNKPIAPGGARFFKP